MIMEKKTGSDENILEFLRNPQNQKVSDYLKKGYKCKEAAKLEKVLFNTVTKINKLGFNDNQN